MAITVTYTGPLVPPADPGCDGYERVRLTLDGSATSVAVTLPATAPGKRIMGCVGGTSHNIGSSGVLGTTGFTVKFPAGTNGEFLDLLLICRGSV
jgi:hypothetical protein